MRKTNLLSWITNVIHQELRRFHQMNHGCGDSCVGGQLALVTKTVEDVGDLGSFAACLGLPVADTPGELSRR
jgi:hypothetical protein